MLKPLNQHNRTKEPSQEGNGRKNREREELTMHLKGQGKKRMLRRIKTGLIVKNKLMIKLRSFGQPRRKSIQNSKGLQSRLQQQYRKHPWFNLKDSWEFSNPQQVWRKKCSKRILYNSFKFKTRLVQRQLTHRVGFLLSPTWIVKLHSILSPFKIKYLR